MAQSVPESTYRVQFHAGFTFGDAARIVPYLKQLGVTHLYASPYMKAAAGSKHGYDVIDQNQFNPELGGEKGFRELVATLKQHGIEQILDTVPNHMGIATSENAWWNDVLENGQEATHGQYFDIAWELSPRPYLKGKVLLPILGEHYGKVLESGQLRLVVESGRYFLAYFDKRLPVNVASVKRISKRVAGRPEELPDQISSNPDLLHALLGEQHYRLAYWRTAPDEINYRRFFDINDLAALQVERREVFDDAHALTLRLVKDGTVAGLRVDHPDGLYDPQQYFQRLRDAGVKYVLAEKILGSAEPLPLNWPIDGTSGYDSLNMINGLFIDTGNEERFSSVYRQHTGNGQAFGEIAYVSKLLVLKMSMASELNMLAHLLDDIAQSHRDSQDFTLSTLTEALRQVIACFPVYRTYITTDGPGPRDIEVIDIAVSHAKQRSPEVDPSAFDFVGKTLLLESPAERKAMVRFAGKFQQLTAPVTAKGVEDTAYYRYGRLLSINEVGGDPGTFGMSPDCVHSYFSERQRLWPRAMNTLSTHDTKRSEDARARLNVLSEMPDEWSFHLRQWMTMCRDSGVFPDDLYMLLQAVIGIWPMSGGIDESFRNRLKAYVTKALREGKLQSSWIRPDEQYEARMAGLVDSVVGSSEFDKELLPFIRRVSRLGAINSLSQTVLKFMLPGVPDTYQGTELWDLSLVDPDNRRPVDYALRERLLRESQAPHDELLQHWPDGRVKLFATTRLLHARREHRGLFIDGDYRPLAASGKHAQNVYAFQRVSGEQSAVIVVPRLVAGLLGDSGRWPIGPDAWGDTALDHQLGQAKSIFNGDAPRTNQLSDLLPSLPFGVFITGDERR